MNIVCKELTDPATIKKFMTHPLLFNSSMPDEDLVAFERGIWEPTSNWFYLGAYAGDELIAISRWMPLTTIAVEWHLQVLPEFWGTGMSGVINKAYEQWYKEIPRATRLQTVIPRPCQEVLRATLKVGYEVEGTMRKAIVWRGNVEDMILVGKVL